MQISLMVGGTGAAGAARASRASRALALAPAFAPAGSGITCPPDEVTLRANASRFHRSCFNSKLCHSSRKTLSFSLTLPAFCIM